MHTQSPAVSIVPQDDTSTPTTQQLLSPSDSFIPRHIGPSAAEIQAMLEAIGIDSLDQLADRAVPESIRLRRPLEIGPARGEFETLQSLHAVAKRNRVVRSCIGMGYYDTITPPVILRNVLENPGWYTQYTPYQPEISQGRLESLLNFQTMVSDLCALPLANASLLDEATAAAEAMGMCVGQTERHTFFVDDRCHPQTIAVVRTRAQSMGRRMRRRADQLRACGSRYGLRRRARSVSDDRRRGTGLRRTGRECAWRRRDAGRRDGLARIDAAAAAGRVRGGYRRRQRATVRRAARLRRPARGFLATRTEFARKMPGRLIGMSRDAAGNPALRLALQTREQHIRRDKATSNICTAQALLANVAALYACYHGPEGLKRIAQRTHAMARALAAGVVRLGHDAGSSPFFDTVKIKLNGLDADAVLSTALAVGYNLRKFDDSTVGVSFDETTTRDDVEAVLGAFAGGSTFRLNVDELADTEQSQIANRKSPFLTHPIFNTHHSETEMLRYIFKLMSRDLSLAQSMIPLGSCTMNLNGTSEMIPVTWPEFGRMHPFAPSDQTLGYAQVFKELEAWLAEITGFEKVWLQPNAGSQGEYAGLLAIHAYHAAKGESDRTVCLIPESAHGTNPASAVIAGFTVVVVATDAGGNIDVADLRKKAEANKADARRTHDHLPFHPRCVRRVRQGSLLHHPRVRRTGLHGRREHERPGRPVPAGRYRGRRLPPQPAQDLLHPPRRWRAGHGADRGRRASRAVYPARIGTLRSCRACDRRRLRRPLRLAVDPADLVDGTSP